MNYRNLRHLLEPSRLVLSIEGEGDTGGGGGAPAAAPAAEPPAAPAPEAGGDPPAPAADAPAPAPADVGDEPPAPKPTRTPWQDKRVDKYAAIAKAAEERATAAAAEAAENRRQLDAYRALYGADAVPPAAPAAAPAAPATGATYTQEDVQREAQRIAGLNRLNERCDAMFTAGKAAHGDGFVAACSAAGKAFGADLAGRVDFFEAITDLPNGADVYAQLAGDLDHFAEVLAMSPMKLGMELAKLSAAGATKKEPIVSRVPAPIEPLEGSGGGDFNPETASMDDYEKDFEARRARRAAAG